MQEQNQQNQQEQSTANDFEFLKEKIKERPIDKKKLIQKSIVTASMALLFGLIACVTFLILEPVLNNWLYPEEEPEIITFPQEEDEMLPVDMLTEGNETNQTESIEQVESIQDTTTAEEEPEITQVDEYMQLHKELYALYKEVSTSMVTVTGVKSDVDLFQNIYESEGQTAGVIIANNSKELLILTKKSPLDKAERIMVTFCNGVAVEGEIKGSDMNTDLTVIAVDLKYIRSTVIDHVTVASLGSSMSPDLVCNPVIAVGNIQGYKDNVCYGMVTSVGNVVTMADNQYKMITTDIYGSQSPSGILVNMKGQVVGIIDNAYNHTDTKNLVSAIGITELKGIITKLSNSSTPAYVGIYAQDVAPQLKKTLNLPDGAYISDIDMDSPAMKKGIQKGDIIIQVNEKVINSVSDYMSAIRTCTVDQEILINVLRESKEEYEQMSFTVTTEENNKGR